MGVGWGVNGCFAPSLHQGAVKLILQPLGSEPRGWFEIPAARPDRRLLPAVHGAELGLQEWWRR